LECGLLYRILDRIQKISGEKPRVIDEVKDNEENESSNVGIESEQKE